MSHRGALQSQSAAAWWNASAGSASGFWKEDVTGLLLTSVAGLGLCYASQGFCSIIGAWFITLFCGGVCTLTAETSAPNLCIAWGLSSVFTVTLVLFDVYQLV